MTKLKKNASPGILRGLIIVFAIEKSIQHALLALFFFVKIPGVGTPDIGPHFAIGNTTMGALNFIYFLLFCLALGLFLKRNKAAFFSLIILAALDIALEFIFHGFFFITVSVIMSIFLILFCVLYSKKEKSPAVNTDSL